MHNSRKLKFLSTAALASALLLVPTMALTQDKKKIKAVETRQGYMKIVLWDAGPLFAMAKGKMDYNAEAAKAHAANLKTISQYPVGGLFIPGTSNADLPNKTRALPKIWEDMNGFDKALANWQGVVATLGNQVGNGQPALATAVGELGKSCGGCHKPYRAPKN